MDIADRNDNILCYHWARYRSIKEILNVNVINTATNPVPVRDVSESNPVTLSGRGVILEGGTSTQVNLRVPNCTQILSSLSWACMLDQKSP